MPTKQIDRLLFAQGGVCYFCKQQIPKSEASVEHLVASANGGNSHDENCVVCCKTVNALLGSMSLKEKIQVVLNQKGSFKCPNAAASAKTNSALKAPNPPSSKPKDDKFALVVQNLKQRGHARPRKVKTLKSTIKSIFPKGLSDSELEQLVSQLQTSSKINISDDNVTYSL